MTHDDLSDEQLGVLIDLYAESNLFVDDLPYSKQFNDMRDEFNNRTGLDIKHHYVWKALCRLRKASKLTRKER